MTNKRPQFPRVPGYVLPIAFAVVAGVALWFTRPAAFAQDDVQDDDGFNVIPLQVEYIDGDVVIQQVDGARFTVTDQGVHEKLNRIEAKIDVLLSRTDDPIATPVPAGVNINAATYDELLTVRGIGPITAGSIIAERGQGGAFASWDEFQRRVAGVGPATVANIRAEGASLE